MQTGSSAGHCTHHEILLADNCRGSSAAHSLIMKHLLQATAEVLLQEAVDDLLDEAHARQEEYYKKHDMSSEDKEVRGRIWFREDLTRLELV